MVCQGCRQPQMVHIPIPMKRMVVMLHWNEISRLCLNLLVSNEVTSSSIDPVLQCGSLAFIQTGIILFNVNHDPLIVFKMFMNWDVTLIIIIGWPIEFVFPRSAWRSECHEVEHCRQLLQRSGGAGCPRKSLLLPTASSPFVDIPSSVVIMQIDGFQKWKSICRIEFPSSVAIIGKYGFDECASLNEVIFRSDSQVKEICGFQKCISLRCIEIPSRRDYSYRESNE
jgi:hypothetical protein